jgi:uncharacterized membrane protein
MFVYTYREPILKKRAKVLGIKLLLFFMLLVWCIGFFSPAFKSDLSFASYPLLNLIYSKFCHQEPSKSFYINGSKLMVCARCTGIYLGALFTLFVLLFINLKLKAVTEVKLLLFSSLPMILDVLLYNIGVYNYSKIVALITGLILGTAAAICINNFIDNSIEKIILYE